jgi:hypothetical protein
MIRFLGYSPQAMAYACVSLTHPLATVRLLGHRFPIFVEVPERNEKLLNSRRGHMPDLILIAFKGDHPE